MKNTINNIIAIALAGAIMVIVFKACTWMARVDRRKPINPNWVTTAGTLVKPRYNARGTTMFKYYFKGRFFQEVSRRYNIDKTQYTVIGEKYLIKLDPEDPSKHIPIESRPTFTDDEATDTVYGRIISTNESTDFEDKKKFELVFEYIVDGNPYQRTQQVPLEDSITFKNLWVGQHFVTRYWEEDPQRAIIYLDSVTSWPVTQ